MKQIHLSECSSTQALLKNKIAEYGHLPLLISTSRQREGRGRRQNRWIHVDNALAFSLTFKPHAEPTLTPLEVASILIKYFQQQGYRLHLKWPNDFLNSHGQKCGGILCTYLSGETVLVGIGLNVGRADFDELTKDMVAPGSIDDNKMLSEQDKQKIPLDIYHHLVKNRMSSQQVLNTWNQHCFHQGKNVTIVDDDKKVVGLFHGITPKGEAILECEGRREYVAVGSLVM